MSLLLLLLYYYYFAEIWCVGSLRIPGSHTMVKFTYVEIQDGGQPPNFFILKSLSLGSDLFTSLKFRKEFDHMTAIHHNPSR